MRIFLAAAIVISLALPALAQQPDKTPEQLAKERADRAANEAYKRSLRAIPDQGPTDPWGGVRSNDGSKPDTTKAAKSKGANKPTETRTTATRPQ